MLKHNRFFKPAISIVLALSMALPMSAAAFADARSGVGADGSGACTGFYMGAAATDDGSAIWGRTEDYDSTWRKLMGVHPAETHAPGDLFHSSLDGSNFTWPYPAQTLRYIYCKDSVWNEGDQPEGYGEIGMNEKNVAMTATVTLSGKSAISNSKTGSDKVLPDGLDECDSVALVLMQAATAREGCELMAKIIDTVGADGLEASMIGDPNEQWYFQILSGHQYIATKLPKDKLGLSPNIMANVGDANGYTDLTDTANVIASPGIISVAKAAGTLVSADNDTKIKVADSYSNNAVNYESGRLRVAYGYLLGPDVIPTLPTSAYLNYLFAPKANHKYTLYEAMRLLACRGEGNSWEVANPTSNSTSIGNDKTQEAHVLDTRYNMPPELATVEWLAMAPAEFSVYLPYYGNLITEVYDKYDFYDEQAYDNTDPYHNTMWYVFRQIYNLAKSPAPITAASRAKYGDGVKAFWARWQQSLIAQQKSVDGLMVNILNADGRAAAEKTATYLSKSVAKETYQCAVNMLEELKAYTANPGAGAFTPSAMADPAALPHYMPHTVTFDSKGGSGVAPAMVTYWDPAVKPADPTRSGYNFAGWYTDRNAPVDFSAPVDSDMTLHAVWNVCLASSVAVSASASTVKKGTSIQLRASVSPDNALDKSVTWSSSNSSVAVVDANGNVKGLQTGTVRITAATSNGKTYMFLLMVTA